jgi:plastocyanin
MTKRLALLLLMVAVGLLAAAPGAMAASGVKTMHFRAGPYSVRPGANLILVDKDQLPKPKVPGYVTSIKPNLHYAAAGGKLGAIPRVDVIHLHHGVWLSNGRAGSGYGPGYAHFYPFFAAGEEKTSYQLPKGYGYPVNPKDAWILNYMIHDLTPQPAKVYVTYTIGFVPASSPAARHIVAAHPIWMDVQNGSLYPVFDVKRHSGTRGRFTYPLQAKDPYRGGPAKNTFTMPTDGVLLTTGGHVHPGGMWDQLDVTRPGTTPSYGHRGKGVRRGLTKGSVRLFRSRAHYWDPRGPISWDMAMGVTGRRWRPRVKAGDVLSINANYETKRASWYESMGIMVTYFAPDAKGGVDPFRHAIDQSSHLTHGHLAENRHHGGTALLTARPSSWRPCKTSTVQIRNFIYNPGDLTAQGKAKCAPTVAQGGSVTFQNDDASTLAPGNPLFPNQSYVKSIFHTITSCKSPCGLDTGISYPLANGRGNYDSAQLGFGTPAANRITWKTPASLKPGTYTYFCRIHPFMRGTFRIVSKTS